jgi:hypothetical protein
MPEKRHFFPEGMLGFRHAAEPPSLGFQRVLATFLLFLLPGLTAQAVSLFRSFIAQGLLEFAALLDPPAHVCHRDLAVGPSREGKRIGRLMGRKKRVHRIHPTKCVEGFYFLRAAPKPCSVEQVGGLIQGPNGFGWREHGNETSGLEKSCGTWGSPGFPAIPSCPFPLTRG